MPAEAYGLAASSRYRESRWRVPPFRASILCDVRMYALHRVSFGVDTTHQCIVWPKDLPLFGACRLSKTELLTSVGRLSMTARTYATPLSLSIATCSTCDAVWFGADAFPPLLPTIDGQSHAVGQRSPPSTWGPGVDISPLSVYHLTWMDAQLSRFLMIEGPWLSSITWPLPSIPHSLMALVSEERVAHTACTRPGLSARVASALLHLQLLLNDY
jgi:hypothetical protein